jgi:stalled ribosome rescue protein Dom34
MNRKVGLWLDHNKAFVVSITNNGETRRIITSDMEHYVRYSKQTPGDGTPADERDRRYWNHLNEYYANVISKIGDAKSILILGPGDAKYELKKQLEDKGMSENIVGIDDIEKITDKQIIKIVRERFPARSEFDLTS